MSLSENLNRVLVSIIAIPVILAACYFGRIYFLIFVLAIALVSFYEFALMSKKKEINLNIPVGFLAILFLILNQYRHMLEVFYFLSAFVVLLTLVELFRNSGSAILNIGSTLLGTFYIGLFASALIGIREFYPSVGETYYNGGFLIISIFASIWVCDSAAYYIGTPFGKHKLFPRVSPKKSWEGAIAGFVFAILTFVAAKFLVLNFLSLASAIYIGAIVGTIGQLGDLIESLFKRDAGVKDSSSIIPGHGGIFDRFDSLLYTAPVVLLYLRFFNR